MPSLFYKAAFERRFPLSFLFFEDLGVETAALGELPEYETVQEAIKKCLRRAMPDREITDEDVEYVADRLEGLEREEEAEDEGKGGGKQGFATSFSTWMAGLDPHSMCIVIASFNYESARELYCDIDREDVLVIATQWVHREWESIKVGYESVVYGFGGSYKDSGPEAIDVSTKDHTQGEVIKPSALAAAGF